MHIKRLPSILQISATTLGGLMVLWWARHGISQARRIAELEQKLGMDPAGTQAHLVRMERMFFWETGAFLLLFLGLGLVLIFVYARDQKRAHSIRGFFAGVTHELRTPLTSIRLQAESIADRVKSEPQLIQRLLQDTLRLENQVERTLELARVEGGGAINTEPMNLVPWLRQWVVRCQEQYKGQATLIVELDVSEALTHAAWNADRVRLEMVLKNLIENSIRHSGQVEPQISIKLWSKDEGNSHWGIIQVTDNGTTPIPRKNKFGELFEKGGRSGGSGVGLYLCTKLIEAMGGKIEFVANDQRGFITIIMLKVDYNG